VLGLAQHLAHLAHDLRLQRGCGGSRGAPSGGRLRRMQMGHVEMRRGQALDDLVGVANGARDESPRTLRVVVVVRAEPAFEDVAAVALQVENFESHGRYMVAARKNTR